MVKEAIFHKMDKEYCYVIESGKFLIKIKTKKEDIKQINLKYGDKYRLGYKVENIVSKAMNKVASDDLFDYYEAEIEIDMICIRYFFELIDMDGEITYYGSYHFYSEEITFIDNMFDASQQVREEEIFDTPKWAEGAIVYEIFPERFAIDKARKLKLNCYDDWYSTSLKHDSRLGGSIRGITENIDYIKGLGTDLIYLTPIFQSVSNHKYDTKDYMELDPEFGTKEDFKELVDEIHKRGMKIILDGVFNHTGIEFLPFKDVVEKGQESKYVDWFYIKDFPIKIQPGKVPNYTSFAYYYKMPKLNTKNPEVRNYIFGVIDYWMNEFKIDGWRLDVADEVPHDFWKAFRKRVKKNNSEAIIVGEIWYEASPWLLGDEHDSEMNYLFRYSLEDWIVSGNISASAFANRMGEIRGRYHKKVYNLLWNLIDSHDTTRFLHDAEEDKSKLKLAVLLQFTMTGMPMIYYGDEYGMTGGKDPDCRRGMLWDENRQDKDMFEYYKKLISIRKNSDALKIGDLVNVITDDQKNLYVYKKVSGQEEFLVMVNANEKPVECKMHVGQIDLLTNETYKGMVPGKGGVLIKIKDSDWETINS